MRPALLAALLLLPCLEMVPVPAPAPSWRPLLAHLLPIVELELTLETSAGSRGGGRLPRWELALWWTPPLNLAQPEGRLGTRHTARRASLCAKLRRIEGRRGQAAELERARIHAELDALR